jgi:hypothetical protein
MDTEKLADHLAFTLDAAKRQGVPDRTIFEAIRKATKVVFTSVTVADMESLHTINDAAAIGRREMIEAHGGSLKSAEAVAHYKVGGEAALRKAAREGRAVAAKHDGEWYFPVWQFKKLGGVVDGLPEILRILREHPAYDDMAPFTFFLTPNAITGNEAPIDLLVRGDFEPVEQAAQAEGA